MDQVDIIKKIDLRKLSYSNEPLRLQTNTYHFDGETDDAS